MKVYKVSLYCDGKSQGHYFDKDLDKGIMSMINDLEADSGYSYRIEAITMSEKRYKELPEFEGW